MQALLAKFERYTKLSALDAQLLGHIGAQHHFGSHQELITEGEESTCVRVVQSGWACRYKALADGKRQILSFCLPGDLCDHNFFKLRAADHSVSTITPVSIAEISRYEFESMMSERPHIAHALW